MPDLATLLPADLPSAAAANLTPADGDFSPTGNGDLNPAAADLPPTRNDHLIPAAADLSPTGNDDLTTAAALAPAAADLTPTPAAPDLSPTGNGDLTPAAEDLPPAAGKDDHTHPGNGDLIHAAADLPPASGEDDLTPAAVTAPVWGARLRFPALTRRSCLKRDRKPAGTTRSLADHIKTWADAKIAAGSSERDCELPFLTNTPKSVECRICWRRVYSDDRLKCTVSGCRVVLHKSCAEKNKIPNRVKNPFKCPQHVCFICKEKNHWRCVRCTMAAHTKCSPWPEDCISSSNRPVQTVCWRHPNDWRIAEEHVNRTSDVEEAFCRLPLPYFDEEFKIDSILKDVMDNKTEPAPYVHIKRNLYLVKKKRDGGEAGVGCTNCNSNSTCTDKCECRGLSVSCSKACHCSDMCRNRPFRKEKKIKIVKTQSCGWGVESLEPLEKGDFVVEYIGEVIDDALCEQRLWDMKRRGDRNFYMCEVSKDHTIDATFKGNISRFLNHSCDPNCQLEKWQVDGETRVGVFASRTIEVGEPLTYDYRFEHFGPVSKCNCGASNCQGFLGSKRKANQDPFSVFEKEDPVSIFEKDPFCWGCKRRRSTVVRVSSK